MLLLLLCFLLCGISNGEYSVRCDSGDGLSFVEANDDVRGRYRLEWCTQLNRSMGQSGQWVLSLYYNTRRKPEDCHQYQSLTGEYFSWKKHSYFEEDVRLDLNCTNVCLSTCLDLIFNGTCYGFKTHLTAIHSDEKRRFGEHEYAHYINNKYPKNYFTDSTAYFEILPSGEQRVKVHWFLHLVPATNYTMVLCSRTKSELSETCTSVTNNCTTIVPSRTEILCELWPPEGLYSLQLEHFAPWANGAALFDKIIRINIPFNESVSIESVVPPAVVQPASVAPWWALGGVLALVLGGGAALLACRSHILRKLRERVQLDWRNRTQVEEMVRPEGVGGRRVLLLYARDCAPMMTVAAQLRALLRRSADHVYDLYSADVVREAARAPGEWVRRVISRADVRVVLLQSPAAVCLHAPALRERGSPPSLTLEQPLLNRRVVYRAPHSSDSLLPLALRLLTDTAHTTHSYKKFYIATIDGLEAELVREVTPLRRYSLPAATEVLLGDLCDGTLSPDLELQAQVQRFFKAVQDLYDHVKANPDYLDEELIFFDYD